MTNIRRGQPKHDYVNSLETLTSPEVFLNMIEPAFRALVLKKRYFLIRVSYIFVFPESFPKGFLVKKDGLTDIRKINVKKYLKWMNDNELFTPTKAELATQMRNLSNEITKIENLVDMKFDKEYNVKTPLDEDKQLLQLLNSVESIIDNSKML